jgi:hypothetical protein
LSFEAVTTLFAQIAFHLAVRVHGRNDGRLVKSTICGALHKAEDYSLAAAASTVRSWHVSEENEWRLYGGKFSISTDSMWPFRNKTARLPFQFLHLLLEQIPDLSQQHFLI